MPRGGKRIGAGRKPTPLNVLLATGRFRPSRHRHLVKAVPRIDGAAVPALSPNVPPIPEVVLEGLGDVGRQFVGDLWNEFGSWNTAELRLLRQAARIVDDFEAATDARGRRLATQTFQRLVQQLGLTDSKR